MKFLFSIVVILFLVQTASAQDSLSSAAPLKGRTTGRLPYLEYGWGDDRLGGAKMGYLDSNVYLKVVDSMANDYIVQLSRYHRAYIPKDSWKQLDTIQERRGYLTGSWRVYGDEKYDYVQMGMEEKLPYTSMQEISPSKIIVDVYGVVSNSNWMTQLKSVQEIKNVWYEQKEEDVFRIHIELKHGQHWGHSIYYKGNTLVIRVKRPPQKLRLRDLEIVIDAGHGGSNSGASGVTTKILEKDYTLKIAKELEKELKRKKSHVSMTRTEDVDLGMVDRTLMIREKDPNLMISIHLNSSSNQQIQGVSTYYRYIGFRPLSQKILNSMLELDLKEFGNVGAFNFALSGPTEYPNCLVEVAFLSNVSDEKKIMDPKFQKAVAKKICDGINDWIRSR